MQKPAMKKYFISIVALSLCLLVTSVAEARLTLGVVIGPGTETGALTRDQVQSLASQLMDKLDDNITIKELPDSTTLVNWLDQFAAVDMALLPSVGPLIPRGPSPLWPARGLVAISPNVRRNWFEKQAFRHGVRLLPRPPNGSRLTR